ncbi:MAG: hypothetical protein LC721_12480 [Actinobacteria bacterium]|nr:hypothetical protein [Actinomycetota bacterium]
MAHGHPAADPPGPPRRHHRTRQRRPARATPPTLRPDQQALPIVELAEPNTVYGYSFIVTNREVSTRTKPLPWSTGTGTEPRSKTSSATPNSAPRCGTFLGTSTAQAGYDVALIVGRPPHHELEGVPIIGVGTATSRCDRAYRVAWKIYRAARRDRADIYQFDDLELFWIGLLLKLHGHKIIYDVHEDVPKQILNKFWLPSWLRRPCAAMARMVEYISTTVFDAVVVANPVTADRFPAR